MLATASELTPNSAFSECHEDYETVRQVLQHITENWQDHPELEELTELTGVGATRLQKTFTRWAGISPKAFLQAVTLDHAKRLLEEGMPLLDTSYEGSGDDLVAEIEADRDEIVAYLDANISTILPPGFKAPLFSASQIMFAPIRHLTE